ncbi:MAG TPA: MBL fold metallo-hydrolase [Clostridiaceae bacterium]
MDNFDSNWYKVKKLTDTVWYISDNNFDLMYLIAGSEKALLIDTGYGLGDLPKLCKELTDLPIISVLTHSHPDHAMGAGEFDTNFITKEDIKMLKDVSGKEFRRNWISTFMKENSPKYDFDPSFIDDWVNRGINNIEIIKDGDIFDLGDRKLLVIASPGHTVGSICLLDEKEGLLFCGDTLVTCNHLLNLHESAPFGVFMKSLENLETFQDKYSIIHPGHEKAPLKKEKLQEVIGGVKDILSGKIKGKLFESWVGPALRCEFGENNWIIAPVDVAKGK